MSKLVEFKGIFPKSMGSYYTDKDQDNILSGLGFSYFVDDYPDNKTERKFWDVLAWSEENLTEEFTLAFYETKNVVRFYLK